MLEKIKAFFAKKIGEKEKRKQLIAVLSGITFLVILTVVLAAADRIRTNRAERQRREALGNMIVWYTNDSLTGYLEGAAEKYEEETGMKVIPKKVSPADYINTIYSSSVSDTASTPDVYIAANDVLEQAYLTGTASGEYVELSEEEFPSTAINAVTYKGKAVAYPFYFDTSIMFYNKNYIQELPASMEEMLTLADSMEIPEGVENVLKWDCSDGFRNYFFGGAYMNLAGEDGDDPSQLELSNDSLAQALTYFQTMNDYFSIDIDSVTEEQIIDEFAAGKTIFCFGDTSWFSALEEKGMTDYGTAVLPGLNDMLESRGIAVTNAVVINGFSKKQEEAADFAEFLTKDYAGNLYEMSKKVPASSVVELTNEGCLAAVEQYRTCVQLPKLMNMGDFWVQFEIAIDEIWCGSDVTSVMTDLENRTNARIQQ